MHTILESTRGICRTNAYDSAPPYSLNSDKAQFTRPMIRDIMGTHATVSKLDPGDRPTSPRIE